MSMIMRNLLSVEHLSRKLFVPRFCSTNVTSNVDISASKAAANEEPNPKVENISSAGAKPKRRTLSRRDYRFIFPEFLPDPWRPWRNPLREKLERKDMLKRRDNVEIPEFYVGSLVAVTTSDPNSPSPDKTTRFNGIVIDRGGTGLRAWIIVRNHIDGIGVEFMYRIYSPLVQKIEILRLERRLDDELYYLRDADPKYSTIPVDMEPEILPEGLPVPLNDVVVPLNPWPWSKRWELYTTPSRLKGYSFNKSDVPEHRLDNWRMSTDELNLNWTIATEKYDLMLQYRKTIPIEEQDAIWAEVGEALEERDKAMRKVAAKRAFSKPVKRG